jgi:hypothetical protein
MKLVRQCGVSFAGVAGFRKGTPVAIFLLLVLLVSSACEREKNKERKTKRGSGLRFCDSVLSVIRTIGAC